MFIRAVDAISGENIFSYGVEGIMPAPVTGDILMDAQFRQFRVIQRTYVVHEVKPTDKALNLAALKTINVEIQCEVCPVGQEQEYAERMAN